MFNGKTPLNTCHLLTSSVILTLTEPLERTDTRKLKSVSTVGALTFPTNEPSIECTVERSRAYYSNETKLKLKLEHIVNGSKLRQLTLSPFVGGSLLRYLLQKPVSAQVLNFDLSTASHRLKTTIAEINRIIRINDNGDGRRG